MAHACPTSGTLLLDRARFWPAWRRTGVRRVLPGEEAADSRRVARPARGFAPPKAPLRGHLPQAEVPHSRRPEAPDLGQLLAGADLLGVDEQVPPQPRSRSAGGPRRDRRGGFRSTARQRQPSVVRYPEGQPAVLRAPPAARIQTVEPADEPPDTQRPDQLPADRAAVGQRERPVARPEERRDTGPDWTREYLDVGATVWWAPSSRFYLVGALDWMHDDQETQIRIPLMEG